MGTSESKDTSAAPQHLGQHGATQGSEESSWDVRPVFVPGEHRKRTGVSPKFLHAFAAFIESLRQGAAPPTATREARILLKLFQTFHPGLFRPRGAEDGDAHSHAPTLTSTDDVLQHVVSPVLTQYRPCALTDFFRRSHNLDTQVCAQPR